MFNKRDQAVLDWVKKNRPDCFLNVKDILEEGSSLHGNRELQGIYLLMLFAFEGGRHFQDDTKAPLNNPMIY